MQVNLKPLAKAEGAMLSYLDINFRRISDTLASLTNVEQGVLEITGSVEIDTGMPQVYNCFAGFNDAPSSGAAFIRAFPVGPSDPKNIVIEVYNDSFGASSTAVNVAWYAIGE